MGINGTAQRGGFLAYQVPKGNIGLQWMGIQAEELSGDKRRSNSSPAKNQLGK